MPRRTALVFSALSLLGLFLAAPAEAAVTTSLDPNADLVDGQEVRLVVDGLPAQQGGSYAEILQCRTPVTDRAADCTNYGDYRHVSAVGHLVSHMTVRALLLLPGDAYDCRTGTCGLRVAIDGGDDAATVVPLPFDPSGPAPDPPTVTASPSTDLVDGQRVTVHGSGLAAYDNVALRLCPDGGANADCLRLAASTFGDENGEFTVSFRTWTILDRPGATTDCRVTACVLRADFTYGIAAPIELTLGYDPSGDLLEPQVVVAPHTDLGPRQSVTVRMVGFHDLRYGLLVHQCLGRPGTPVNLSHCDRSRDETIDQRYGSVRVSVRRLLHTARGEVDCSIRRCRIWADRTREALALASEPLEFRPRH